VFAEGDAVRIKGGAEYGLDDLVGKNGVIIAFDGFWVVVDVDGNLERIHPADLERA
jgi:hypothetical protein